MATTITGAELRKFIESSRFSVSKIADAMGTSQSSLSHQMERGCSQKYFELVKWAVNHIDDSDYSKPNYIGDFLTKMDKLFTAYKNSGIMEGYRRIGNFGMEISEEANKKDHDYIWCALDGAIYIYNQEHLDAHISFDECQPRGGMVRYEFSYEK